MRKLLTFLVLMLLPVSARAQTLLSSSAALIGTSTPLVLTVLQYQEYNITLTANTPIQFNVPVIAGTLIFRLNLCESNGGGWAPAYSIVQGGNTLVNNLGSTMFNTANGACETQQWSWRQQSKQLILESDTALTGAPSQTLPINSLPNQSGNYNARGFELQGIGVAGTLGDALSWGNPANVTNLTGSGVESITGSGGNTSSTITNKISKVNLDGALDVQSFTGADACAQFNNAVTYAQANNIQDIWWEPGSYTVTTECQIPSNSAQTNGVLNIWAYGVVLTGSGLTTEFNVAMATNWGKLSIYGLKINDLNNTTVTTGMNFGGVYQTSCTDCSVIANSGTTASGYTNVHIGNSTPGTDSTFTQSMQFTRGLFVGAGSSGCDITMDSAFQTSFSHSKISGGSYAVCMQTDPATAGTTARMPVFPSFADNDMESFTGSCFYLNPGTNGTGTYWNGGSFIGNRCDRNGAGTDETTAFFTVGSNYTAGALQATVFLGNHPVGLGQYLNNTTNVAFPIASLDDAIIDSTHPTIPGYPGMTIQNGLTVDNLVLQNGIGGGTGTLQVGAPTLSVGCLGTCGSTQYCYKGTAVDSKGYETNSNAQVCVSTGPASLSSSGEMEITAETTKNHPCGYRIYGRANGNTLLMLPASPPTCGGTTVSMLSTANGHTLGPALIDNGSITPSGAVPTVDGTGVFQIASPADEALSVLNGGHITSLIGTGAAPTSGTGSVTAGGTDTAFEVTGGTSPVTVTFGTAYHAKPSCACNDETSALGACKAVANSNGQTVVVTTTATDSFNAICIGK